MPIRPNFPPSGAVPPRSWVAPEKAAARAGAGGGAESRPPLPGEASIELRLGIGRNGVGLELARPVRIGCIAVTELTATLPGIRFPVDVSGGVPRFRHRRGVLQTVQIELGARMLERWASPRLRGLVGTRAPEVWVGVRPAGATLGVAAVVDAEHGADPRRLSSLGAGHDLPAASVVAFEVDAIAERGDLILVVKRARGSDLPAPATAIAIACAEAILHGVAKREGALFVIRGGAGALARALLPEVGARVPAAEGLGWTSIGAHADTWIVHATRDALSAAPSEEALRAREVATMLREADESLVAGDLPSARALSLEALERAPRHSEIVRRVLEIDARTPGRAEAALATLADARALEGEPAFGTTPGELLAQIGDHDAAVASFERAGDSEPTPALAARAFEMAASLSGDAEEGARWLDRAVVRSPRSTTARWLRVTRRLELGRIDDALADVEHLEALARGGRAKHVVWVEAGRAWRAAGLGARAGTLFERALRYAPDEPQALAGLGTALVEQGHEARGVAALALAIDLADARTDDASTRGIAPTTAPILLELARALAERLDDLPAAIARVSAIPADATEAPIARGLEGRWRARLGDLAGAALAYARLRELAATIAAAPEDPRTTAMVSLLVEGAELMRARLHDVRGAQRYLATAMRLRPHDAEVRRLYRDIGVLVAQGDRTTPVEDAPSPEGAMSAPLQEARTALDLALAPEAPSTEDQAQAGARAEELTRRLHATPGDDAVADELASVLESLGRGHELLALLSARLEDASAERRAVLAPRARVALERLAGEAAAAGRSEEAALYRAAALNLVPQS
jgi:tetratricopeptide (TPR) repeat protein